MSGGGVTTKFDHLVLLHKILIVRQKKYIIYLTRGGRYAREISD